MELQRVITSKHNLPPTDAQILTETLGEKYFDQITKVEDLASREIPDEISEEKVAGEITDYIKSLGLQKSEIEKIHTAEKKPYLDAGRVVDGFKNKYVEMLEDAKKRALAPLDAFLARKEQEENTRLLAIAEENRKRAEALALEAELHAKAEIHDTAEELMDKAFQKDEQAIAIHDYALSAPSSRLAKIRSSGGSSASRRTFWVAEYITPAGLDLNEVKDFFKPEEIQAAYDRHVKQYADSKELKGVKIYQKTELKGVR